MAPIETARTIFLLDNTLVKLKILKKVQRKRRKTHQIYIDRLNFGEFHHLYPQLRVDKNAFRQYTRMLPDTFDYIVEAIEHRTFRVSISAMSVSMTRDQRQLRAVRAKTNNLIFQTHRAVRQRKKNAPARTFIPRRTAPLHSMGFIHCGYRIARNAPHAPYISCLARTRRKFGLVL